MRNWGLLILLFWGLGAVAFDKFCTDPMGAICTDTKKKREARENRINQLKKKIFNEASELALEEGPSDQSLLRGLIERWIFRNNQSVSNILKVSAKYISGFEKETVTRPNIMRVKGALYKAIEKSRLPGNVKHNFKLIVKNTKVGMLSDLNIKFKNKHKAKSFRGAYEYTCGEDGLEDNAFAISSWGQDYVVLCPGWLITLNKTANEKEKFFNIFQVLVHEFAHHIDSRGFPQIYEKLSQCYQKYHAQSFNKTGIDHFFCEENPKECNKRVVESHLGEVSSDIWAIQASLQYMKEQSFYQEDIFNMYKFGMVKLCDSTDEGVHPSGAFRIGTMLRGNPDVGIAMNCDLYQDKRDIWCGLDGADSPY